MKTSARFFLCALLIFVSLLAAPAQTRVADMFGRSLNQRGVTLVDWDGYLANPLIKIYLLPPTNAVLPGSATLAANGVRLYFDNPSTVSTNGPGKTVSLTSTNVAVPVGVSIFPDRDGADEDYTLTIVFTGADSVKQTNTLPIHVIDQDLQRTNEFFVTLNFDRDVTGFFTNANRRAIVRTAVDDWSYFFTSMDLDEVAAGTESTYIWSNQFAGGNYFLNTNTYTGYLLYAYGTTNSAHRSGGEASFYGGAQSTNGTPLTLHRSGGFEAEIYGNYNTLGWLYNTNDNDWLATGNFGNETNDFFSITHHETGHALAFNVGHPGFNFAKTNGGFSSFAVTNYYGSNVVIDATDHISGAIDPESGQGAFGYDYYGNIPRKRWLITKLDLLCAQEVGYELRTNSLFAPLSIATSALPAATVAVFYTNALVASGGIAFYNWDLTNGALPPGLALDSFTGALTGTPTNLGVYNFTGRLRDYHATGGGVAQTFTLNVTATGSAPTLSIKLTATNTVLVFWPSPSTGYNLQVNTSLATTNWVTPAETVQTNGANKFILVNPPAGSRFYRLKNP